MAERSVSAVVAILIALGATCAASGAVAQQAIGATTTAQNQVTREISGAAGPLSACVFRLSKRGCAHRNGLARQAHFPRLRPISPSGRRRGSCWTASSTRASSKHRKSCGGPCERPFPVHHRQSRQEGIYDQHADRGHRRPRHGARHRRSDCRYARDACRGAGARLSTTQRRELRATGARLQQRFRRRGPAHRALRVCRTRSSRPNGAGEEIRRDDHREHDGPGRRFRLAVCGGWRSAPTTPTAIRALAGILGGSCAVDRHNDDHTASPARRCRGRRDARDVAWTDQAAAYCAWGVLDGAPYTNVFALQGTDSVCTVTPSGLAFQAGCNVLGLSPWSIPAHSLHRLCVPRLRRRPNHRDGKRDQHNVV